MTRRTVSRARTMTLRIHARLLEPARGDHRGQERQVDEAGGNRAAAQSQRVKRRVERVVQR